MPIVSAGIMGGLSALLPCGFLYMMVVATIPLQNPILSAGLMAAFWLGTLPGLMLGPLILQKILPTQNKSLHKLIGGLFILLGLITLFFLK